MPLNRVVKPTIGICCEFAQKHGAEFVQNFFEKAIDKFVRRVYNKCVPGKTGTKKAAGHGGKRYRHDIRKNLHQALQGACYNNMRYLRRTHRKDDAPRTRLGTGNAEGHIQHQLAHDGMR